MLGNYYSVNINKFVFIKEDMCLVIEINPIQEAVKLNNTILFYLVQKNGESIPIQLTTETKSNVIEFLKREYKYKNEINKLINFFSRMKPSEYLYIYPYFKQMDEYYDLLKESLKFYNQHLGEDYVCKNMREYFELIHQVKNMLEEWNYDIAIYVPKKIQRLGEPNKQKRKCIYCGECMENNTASFKEDAHAIPEALGNKTYIQREECDCCNDFFARNVEEDLCNWLGMVRLKYGIRGKNGLPIFQFKDLYARYIDTSQIEQDWGMFEVIRNKLKDKEFKGPVLISSKDLTQDKKLDITYIKCYKPLHIYKALVKCVIGLMDKKYLRYFENTISWLKQGDIVTDLPKVILFDSLKISLEPELYIFTRKDDNYFLPYCYGELRVADIIFVFIVPFASKDNKDFSHDKNFLLFLNYILGIYQKSYKLMDFSSIQDEPIQYSLNFAKKITI